MDTPSPESRLPRVGLIGAGTMGSAMALRLLEGGFAVDVWDRANEAAARLAERGARAHPDAAGAVATAGVVLTMLPTGEATSEVMLEAGTLDALARDAVWAQMGTIGVEATESLNRSVAERRPDVAFVDAPVSGSREPARTGQLMVLASGPERARAAAQPVFEALGRRVLWLGPAGMGSRLKLVLNTWLAFEIEAAAEAGALAERLGIPQAVLDDAVHGAPLASGLATAKLAKMESGDDSTDFSLEWALKDLDLAMAAAGTAATPVARNIAERWRGLVEQGHGRLDVSAARLGLNTPAADTHGSGAAPRE